MVDLDDPAPTGDLRDAIEQFYFAYRGFTDRPDRILEKRGWGGCITASSISSAAGPMFRCAACWTCWPSASRP
jgi:uncharacterized Fe-S cluster-containing radical SAM superfamily protein